MTLSNISTSVTELQTSAASLNDTLQNITTNVKSVNASCMGFCGSLNAATFENGLNNNFQQVFLVIIVTFSYISCTDIVTKYY